MSEKFIIACTYCQKQYPVDDRMVGRRVKCKDCGEVFIVPEPPQTEEDAIDLSEFDQSESLAPAYTPPPAPARPTAYVPPPVFSPPPPPRRFASGGWNTGARRAWWSLPVLVIYICLRIYAAFHHSSGNSTGNSWNPTSATTMTLDEKRDRTVENLRSLGPELKKQVPSLPSGRHFDPAIVHFHDLPTSLFVSPFNPAPPTSGANDYKFLHLESLQHPEMGHAILLYDESELSANDGTTVYRDDDSIEHISKEDFEKQAHADELALNPAWLRRPPPQVITPPPPTFMQPPRFGPPVVVPPNSPSPQPSREPEFIQRTPPRPTPAEQPDADPPIPAHAWTADPDPPATPPKIDPHFQKVFPGNNEFYFPRQPSDYFLLNRVPTMNYHGPLTAELWNLRTAMRADTISAIHQMDDSILSPDGNYFVGRSMGGQGLATVFEVWSPRTGKLLQTLSGPPVTGSELPMPVGFLEGDRLLTIGDRFDVWDLKAGTHVRQFGDGFKFDSHQLATISATGKLAALITADHQTIALFDTATGKLLGQSPIPDRRARRFEFDDSLDTLIFSPGGQQLALFLGGTRIYNWKVADGSLAERFTINPRIDRNNFRKVDSKSDSLTWLPDSEGWLAGGDRVIDRVTGTAIYQMPNFTEDGAREYGQRQVIDDNHVLLGFRTTFGNKSALETMKFDSAELKKTRATLRAAAQPATQPR